MRNMVYPPGLKRKVSVRTVIVALVVLAVVAGLAFGGHLVGPGATTIVNRLQSLPQFKSAKLFAGCGTEGASYGLRVADCAEAQNELINDGWGYDPGGQEYWLNRGLFSRTRAHVRFDPEAPISRPNVSVVIVNWPYN